MKVIYFLGHVLMDNLVSVLLDQEKVSDYETKLMDSDVEQLRIPVSNLYSLFTIGSVQVRCDLFNVH